MTGQEDTHWYHSPYRFGCAYPCRFSDRYFWVFPALLSLHFWLSLHQAISLNALGSKDKFTVMLEGHCRILQARKLLLQTNSAGPVSSIRKPRDAQSTSNKSCLLQTFQSKNPIYCFLFMQLLRPLPGNIPYPAHDSSGVAIRHSFLNSASSTSTDLSIGFLFLNKFWLHKKQKRNRVEQSRKSTPKTQGQFRTLLICICDTCFVSSIPKKRQNSHTDLLTAPVT